MCNRVRLSLNAAADFESRVMALAIRSPRVGRKVVESYARALERLRERPLSCGLAYESSRFDGQVRHLLFGPDPKRRFRALFTVSGDEVVILAIRAAGERPVDPGDLAD
jgi:hypothetical protein